MSIEINPFDKISEENLVYNHMDPGMIAYATYQTVEDAAEKVDTIYFIAQEVGQEALTASKVIKMAGLKQNRAALQRGEYFATGEDYSVDNSATRAAAARSARTPEPIEDVADSLMLLDISIATIEIAIEDANKSAARQSS